MNIHVASVPHLRTIPLAWRGFVAFRLIQATLLLLLVQITVLPSAVAADQTTTTVNLDGKTVFIPEIKLTKRVVPVTTFLFIGSWESSPKVTGDAAPLCSLDLQNNSILIKSSGKLLPNSKTCVVDQNTLSPFLDGMTWGKRQATHFAFKVTSDRIQPAIMELYTDSDAAAFNNGRVAGRVGAAGATAAGGRGYLPIMLKRGVNIINIKQYSKGEPRIQATLYFDHSRDLQTACQARDGLLKNLVNLSNDHSGIPELAWDQSLGNFSVSMEVRDVSTNKIVLKRESVRKGKLFSDDAQNFAPGIYEAVYRKQNDSASEFFIVGNPRDLFAALQDKLSQYSPDAESKLDIEAQLRRARILLAKNNCNLSDRLWQEKTAYTFSCLATFERKLREGATNIAKDQPGLHIRGFASGADNSFQSYRLFIPSSYNPGTPLPLLVHVSTRIAATDRPFIEGPVMASYHSPLLWAKYAEKHGFALLWGGYKGRSEGFTYDSVNMVEAIQAVEKDYNVDKQRISVYATCGAGYNAGRLVSEYPNLFSALVYDRAVFDFPPSDLAQPDPSLVEWLKTARPIPHLLGNKDLKIFVMHDDTRPPGHGPLAFTTQFLAEAKGIRDDIVSYISKQPMTEASRIDQVLSWLTPCKKENPDNARSYYLEKTGHTGPIMEIFATPIIVVEGTHTFNDDDRKNIQGMVESLKSDYTKYFHGAECTIKKDVDVTQEDMETHSLILIGDPLSNSVWGKLQPELPLKATQDNIIYKNAPLAKKDTFEAIVRNPHAADKYILMIGAGDWRNLKQVATNNLFSAWYDCIVFGDPIRIINKLDDPRGDARSGK